MQQEILKKILDAEESANQIRKQASVNSKNIITEQKANANEIIKKINDNARAEYEEIIEKAKIEAAEETEILNKHTSDSINAMKNKAKENMDKAVLIIIDKVVNFN